MILTTLGAGVMFVLAQRQGGFHAPLAVVTIAALVGLAFAGAALNVRISGGNDLAQVIAEIKQQLPDEGELVSLGRVYHRFAYSYDSPIQQVSWPMTAEDLPEGVTYFCFDHRPGDTPEDRAGNDDRLVRTHRACCPLHGRRSPKYRATRSSATKRTARW